MTYFGSSRRSSCRDDQRSFLQWESFKESLVSIHGVTIFVIFVTHLSRSHRCLWKQHGFLLERFSWQNWGWSCNCSIRKDHLGDPSSKFGIHKNLMSKLLSESDFSIYSRDKASGLSLKMILSGEIIQRILLTLTINWTASKSNSTIDLFSKRELCLFQWRFPLQKIKIIAISL